MKCPKCGKPIKQKANKSFYCLYCGYMENGNTITKTKKNISASDLEIYLGDRFDKVYRNENMFTIFLLGPFYFCFNRLLFLGVFCAIINALFYYFWITTFTLSLFKILLLFIIVRILYMTCANMIYMKVYSKKIEKIKLKNPDNYLDILRDSNGKTTSFGMLVLGFLIFVAIVLLCFYMYVYLLKK